jgi:hypothetical protein
MQVFVYRNLHKNCLSVRSVKTKRVIAYVDFILLEDCTFKVSKKGRERVLKEKRKNVHAGIEGRWVNKKIISLKTKLTSRVIYDPYKYKTFVNSKTLKPIHNSKNVFVTIAGAFVLDRAMNGDKDKKTNE